MNTPPIPVVFPLAKRLREIYFPGSLVMQDPCTFFTRSHLLRIMRTWGYGVPMERHMTTKYFWDLLEHYFAPSHAKGHLDLDKEHFWGGLPATPQCSMVNRIMMELDQLYEVYEKCRNLYAIQVLHRFMIPELVELVKEYLGQDKAHVAHY